ncbi:uncharacterized protein LOC126575627 [Anopheles aquasalis]|uniref:uncharacterized protein LOC126575627 n=1 Tax=Anopheles aquasalis TaxID=42839 RepID=UPI00215A1BA4|nr:uncharacterized protein LOC126575627 [Anopheles aquasalis]
MENVARRYSDEEFWHLVDQQLGEPSKRATRQLECEGGPSAHEQDDNVDEEFCDQVRSFEEYPVDSSSDEESVDGDSSSISSSGNDFVSFLKIWSVRENVPNATLSRLLRGLARFLPENQLLGAQTLLRTPRIPIIINQIEGGEYWHRGLEKSLRHLFSDLSEDRTVSLDFNVDGVSLFPRTNKHTWTILGKVFEEPRSDVFVIGLFYGDSKPKRIEEFLEPFVEETNRLIHDPIKMKDKTLNVTIRCFICDAPARAFIRANIGATSYQECLKCKAKGIRVNVAGSRQISYPLAKADARTDEEYRSSSHSKGHMECSVDEKKDEAKTPLSKLDIDMVEHFIVGDSLDVLHLGMMKTYLTDKTKGEHNITKWDTKDVEAMDSIIQSIKLPCEFDRRYPTPISMLSDWNGREFATFLNYVGVAVLKEFLKDDEYTHFLNLFIAVTICSNNIYQDHLDDAQRLIDSFVEEQYKRTGQISSNLHTTIHITNECTRFGPLPQNSTYPFKNFLHKIREAVSHGKNSLQKLANRIEEYSNLPTAPTPQPTYPVLRQKDIIAGTETRYSSIVLRKGFTLKSQHFADCWLLTTSNKIVRMVAATDEFICGVEIVEQHSQFDHTLFDLVRVYYTDNCENVSEEKSYRLDEVCCKLVAVRVNAKVVYIPLHHTLPDSLDSCSAIPI